MTAGNGTGNTYLSVESYREWDGPVEAGTYILDGVNYADCGLCVVIYSDCSDSGCESVFYAYQGTVDVVSLDLISGGSVEVNLIDVVLTEVLVDGGTFTSTPVENARTWCVDGHLALRAKGCRLVTKSLQCLKRGWTRRVWHHVSVPGVSW